MFTTSVKTLLYISKDVEKVNLAVAIQHIKLIHYL